MLFLLLAAGAQTPITADQAMANYRATFSPKAERECGSAADPQEIVVCGRSGGEQSAYRLPLPQEPVRGARVAGEAASPREMTKVDKCTTVGPDQDCGHIPLLAIGMAVAKTAVKIIAKELAED